MSRYSRRQFVARSAIGGALGVAAAQFSLAEEASPKLSESKGARPPRIRMGQIGVAHAHASKLAVYRSSPDYEVVGVVEPDDKLRQAAMKQPAFKDVAWLTEEQLLATSGLQAVLVETAVHELLPTAMRCAAAGLHLHIDKPPGESLSQLKQVLELASAKNRMVQMGYMYRYNPGFTLLQQILKAGWLGDLFEVHAQMSKVVDDESRRQLARYPGGIFFELACHVLDLVISILGAPQAVHSFAQHASGKSDLLQDNMLAVLTYPRAIATIKASAQEVDGGSRRQLVVCGSEGTFQIQPLDQPVARLTLNRPQGKYHQGVNIIPLPPYTRYVDDAADMARVIRSEKASDYPPAHDLLVQSTLLTACGVAIK